VPDGSRRGVAAHLVQALPAAGGGDLQVAGAVAAQLGREAPAGRVAGVAVGVGQAGPTGQPLEDQADLLTPQSRGGLELGPDRGAVRVAPVPLELGPALPLPSAALLPQPARTTQTTKAQGRQGAA
jgi:hypothetical protein